MGKVCWQLRSRRQVGAVLPSILVLMLSVYGPTIVRAALPPANGDAKTQSGPELSPQVSKLLQDADAALKVGQLNLALIQLKNAVRLAPQAGSVRAQLGVLLLRHGEPVAAERELRQARKDHAADDVAVPAILQAMITRRENEELLAEFPVSPEASRDKTTPYVLRARAIALQALGQAMEAKAAIDQALRLNRDLPSLIAAADLAQQQGDFVLARGLTEEATKLAPKNEKAIALTAMLLRQAGENANAISALDDYLQRVPESGVARVLRIELLLEQKQDARAKELIDEILKGYPNSVYGKYFRAVLMAHANDFRAAWQELQNLPGEFVQSEPNIAMMVASIAAGSGNLETAGGILTTALARHPEVTAVRLQLATVRLSQNLPASALDILAPLKSSDAPTVQAVLAQVYLQLRRFDEAIKALEFLTASSSAPPSAASDFLKRELAVSQLQVGDTERGIGSLQTILQRDPENPQLAALLISALEKAGRFDESLRVIDRLEKSPKRGPLPALLRGQVLSTRGDLAGAAVAFNQSLATDPKFVPALYYRANLQVQRGNIDEANKDLQQILTLDPVNMLAYVMLADIAGGREQDLQAVALLEKAIKIAPNNPVPRLALANFQIARAKYPEAQSTVKGLLQIAPNDPDGLALMGRLLFLRGANADAVNTFRALVNANSRSPTAYILFSKALSVVKDQFAAEEAAKKAIELDPISPTAQSNLIEIQFSGGKEESALMTARAYVSAHPGPTADLVLAETLRRARRTNEATALLEKRLASKPDAMIASVLAQFAKDSNDSKKAVAILANWLAKNPNDTMIRIQYGEVLLSTGDEESARKQYEILLKQAPENPLILNNLGWTLQKDDPVRALSLVSLAAKISPGSPYIADTLGWLKMQRRDSQGALLLFQRAHARDPNNSTIAYHLVLALDATGKRADAKALLVSTLAQNPKFDGAEDAKRLLARW